MVIVTGDRDAFQLIDADSRCKVMATSRGITETKLYDREGVIERYGIPPELVPDFIGLKGDTSDNIPGVPGIGDKTAAQLLQQYGSLEEVLAHVDEISGAKRKENLRRARRRRAHLASSSRRCSATSPVDSTRRRRPRGEPDRSRLREVFREFELRDPLRRLEEALGDPQAAAPAPGDGAARCRRASAAARAGGRRARSATATRRWRSSLRARREPRGRAVRARASAGASAPARAARRRWRASCADPASWSPRSASGR